MGLLPGPKGFMPRILMPLVLGVLCDANPFLNGKACGVPDLPAHAGYQCQPPQCEAPLTPGLFNSGTILEFYCQPGYVLARLPALSICQGGQWSQVREVVCQPQGTSPAPPQSSRLPEACIPPLIAAATLVLLAFLVTILSCIPLRLRSSGCRCRCHSSDSYEVFEDLDTLEHVGEPDGNLLGRTVPPLPTYEEAVYGHMRTPWLPGDWGPMPLVFSAGFFSQPELSGIAGGRPDSPPPSYEEAMASAAESLPGGLRSTWGAARLSSPRPGAEDRP